MSKIEINGELLHDIIRGLDSRASLHVFVNFLAFTKARQPSLDVEIICNWPVNEPPNFITEASNWYKQSGQYITHIIQFMGVWFYMPQKHEELYWAYKKL